MQTFILIFKAEANVPYTFPIQLTNSRSIIGATSFFVMKYCVYTTQWLVDINALCVECMAVLSFTPKKVFL